MIPAARIQNLVSPDIHLLAIIVFVLAFVFYKVFLRKISEKRQNSLKLRFISTAKYLLTSFALSGIQYGIFNLNLVQYDNANVWPYFLIFLMVIGTVTIIKLAQIIVYLFLFLSYRSHGVPRLLANMFTFFFSIALIHLIASQIFDVHLSAILATSAVFSLVLGLALQDTLGNLFSGLSLQIESPFKIGDWIEVHSRDKKWLGQVQEVNWRATFLISFSDELIMIPNKTIAQSEIIIISQGSKNIRLSQTFRFSYDVDIAQAKKAIESGVTQVKGLMNDPPVRVLITETNESFITMKVFYSLVDFSLKYRLGDEILTAVIFELNKKQIRLQTSKIEIITDRSAQNI
jgi:small-conductance mechanosensitive channel